MATYISILRGINVSGQKLIKMDALKRMYESLNFEKVKTYIQSGNVVFSTCETNLKKLESQISSRLEKEFGEEVPVIVLKAETLENIIKNNPFANDGQKDTSNIYITFLADKQKEIDKDSIENKKQEGEEIEYSENAIYLYCPNGYGRTKLNNNFLENKLKIKATTRNWKTTNELLKLAGS